MSDLAEKNWDVAYALDHSIPKLNWTFLKAEYERLHPKDPVAEAAAERRMSAIRERNAEFVRRAALIPAAQTPARKSSTCPVCEGKGRHWGSWAPSVVRRDLVTGKPLFDSVTGKTLVESGSTKVGWVTCETCKGSGVLN